ncbi:hypothetical protein B484DRAFT_409068, partial [Ochromonadaceae sp. CCMP2298]
MNSKVHSDQMGFSEFPSPMVDTRVKSKRLLGNEMVEESRQIQQMQHLPFEQVELMQFCIDGAVGLPLCATATRVTARLLDHTRAQIGVSSASTVSQPDGRAEEPRFDLQASWRGSSLSPTVTIVCRIDTLEKPSLQPRCVGFAVLKLCVDKEGIQPDPDRHYDQLFLNSGQFLLPIVYGSVPSNGVFSESLMDRLPHIYDAYLSVRLFDPSQSASTDRPQQSPNRDTRKYDLSKTLLACLIRSLPGTELPPMPLDERLAGEVLGGVGIDAVEKQALVRATSEWLLRIFPPVNQKLGGVNPRFLLDYNDRVGAFVALDMLYNMPPRARLIRDAAEGAARLQSGSVFHKPYDDKTTMFKIYFRYLPGSNLPRKLRGAVDFVIDDASMDLDFGSKELNPVYLDEFSRTTGFSLSTNACLLVVVTAVD